MNYDFKNAAKAYLEREPGEWIRHIEHIANESVEWVQQESNVAFDTSVKREVYDSIFETLLSPEIALLCSDGSSEGGEQEVAQIVGEMLSNKVFEFSEDEFIEQDEVLDYGTEGDYDIPVHREHDPDGEYEGSEFPVSAFVVGETPVDTAEFKEFIIDRLRSGGAEESPVNIYTLSDVELALYKALIENTELIKSMNWRLFEKLLADILDTFGYEIELQKGSNDGGIDIIAVKPQDAFGAQKFLLQAKRYSERKVGIEPVRQLAFLHGHHNVTKTCLATTSTYTSGAWNLAQQYKWQMELKDIEGVLQWVKNAYKIKKRKFEL